MQARGACVGVLSGHVGLFRESRKRKNRNDVLRSAHLWISRPNCHNEASQTDDLPDLSRDSLNENGETS
jgi:hypothetical protein